MTLVELLKNLPENRSARGKMHEQWFVLMLMIMGGMCGYWGYRPLEEFSQRYAPSVCEQLGIEMPKRIPSYSTFRRIIMNVDFVQFAEVFNQWAKKYVPIEEGEWVSVDGKSIKSSVSNYDNAQQNFVMLVSVFSHKRGVVFHSQPMENQVTSEQHVVQQILSVLDLKGAVLTGDALHCQKKPSGNCVNKVPITFSVSKATRKPSTNG